MANVDIAQLNQMPFAMHNGFRFESAADGKAVVSMRIGDFHLNTRGDGHGGVVPMLVDAAGACSVLSAAGGQAFTVDLRVNLISALKSGDVITARGEVTHLGAPIAFTSVVVTNQDGQVVALGQVTCVVRPAADDRKNDRKK